MTLPASGVISFNDINVELGVAGTTEANINQATYRALAGVPSGAISLSNFYGKSNVINAAVFAGTSAYGTQTLTYNLDTDASATGTNLTTGVSPGMGGASTTTIGYIFAGYTAASTFTTATQKYTYTSNGVSSGTALGLARSRTGASGNSTVAIICNGGTGSFGITINQYTDKYTFSGDTCTTGTLLGAASYGTTSATNSTRGIFAYGTSTASAIVATTRKYTYSGDTVAAGTSISSAKTLVISPSNSTIGLFAGGVSSGGGRQTTVDKYTFSTDVVASATALSTAISNAGYASNATFGLIAGGTDGTSLSATSKYNYAGNSYTSGTNLTVATSTMGSACSCYGGLL